MSYNYPPTCDILLRTFGLVFENSLACCYLANAKGKALVYIYIYIYTYIISRYTYIYQYIYMSQMSCLLPIQLFVKKQKIYPSIYPSIMALRVDPRVPDLQASLLQPLDQRQVESPQTGYINSLIPTSNIK